MKISTLLLSTLVLVQLSCKTENNPVQTVSNPQKPFADAHDSLVTSIKKVFNSPEFKNASYSFVLFNPEDSSTWVSINPDLNLVPASVMKVITTAAALEILGPDFRFETKLYYTGNIDNGVLHGDIIIQGGGDPTLGSIKFHSGKGRYSFLNDWVNAVRKAGIDSLTGNIIADASVFDEEGVPTAWQWEDIGAYYGTAAFGISVFDNRFSLKADPQKQGTYSPGLTQTSPYIPGLSVTNNILFSDGAYYLDILGAYFDNHRVLKGVVPADLKELEINASIPDPPLLVGQYLKKYLVKAGVAVGGKVMTSRMMHANGEIPEYGKGILLQTTLSPELADIVKKTNKESNNLFAEHLLKMMGVKKNGLGYVDSGVAAVNELFLAVHAINDPLLIYDGCGIARKNQLNASQLVGIISYMLKCENQQVFVESLPVSGTDGTLVNFCKSDACKGRIHAKSGSMGSVKTYAGYISRNQDSPLVFAVMVNNYTASNSKVRKKLEEILELCIREAG